MQPDGNIILHYHGLKPSLKKDTGNQVSFYDKDDACNNYIYFLTWPEDGQMSGILNHKNH